MSDDNKKNVNAAGFVEEPVAIEANGKKSVGIVEMKYFDKDLRTSRALKVWGGFWGGAFCAVFIPVVHFVLVPTLFLVGLVYPFIIYFQKSQNWGGRGRCPECDKILPISSKSNRWPLKSKCVVCGTESVIQIKQ